MNSKYNFQELIYIDLLKKVDFKTLKNIIKKCPNDIRYVISPNEELQIIALSKDRESFSYVQARSTAAQYIYEHKYCQTIQWMKKPSLKYQKLAVKQDGLSIAWIDLKKIDRKVQELAIRNYSDEVFFVNYCLHKITYYDLLYFLYKNIKNQEFRSLIKASPYWKDDAELILEHIKN